VVAVQCLCGIVAGVLFNQIYAYTVAFFSGFVFLILAAICALSLVVLV